MYVVLNVVFILGVFVPVQSIKTSGMSITLLIEQNVYRYYALTDHTLSLLFTRHQVCFHFMCHVFFNGLSPAFVFTSIISHLFEPQRLEMVTVDTTDRRFLLPPVCGTPLHRAID